MNKFWLDDFRYTQRFGTTKPFGYYFKVRGESANYLINEYGLNYPNIFVKCYSDEKIYIGSCATNDLTGDVYDCEEDDVDELYNLLQPIMSMDMRNYEDYLADDWYQKDSRWE